MMAAVAVDVVVPPGVAAGSTVEFEAPDGARLTATVPEGLDEGDTFRVAVEGGSAASEGTFCVGGALSLADIFLVPQVRNAIGAGLDVEADYPSIAAVWRHCISLPFIIETLEECGGIVQPSEPNLDAKL